MNLTSISTIKELLNRHGLRLSKSRGQNFLIAEWVPERIAESAALDTETGVLEIGPGIGCLTRELALRAGKVVAVELDRGLKPVLAETLADMVNTEVIFADALKLDIPALLSEKFSGMRTVACANLPYNVTTPALTVLLESRAFDEITVMVQREVAQRICSEPGSSDYSSFTVFVNWFAYPEILFHVPPGCFLPAPKVWSSVLRMKIKRQPEVLSEEIFFRTVRAAFAQRRKTLVNALCSGFPELSKQAAEEAVTGLGFSGKIRGESLGIPEFVRLSNVLLNILTKKQ